MSYTEEQLNSFRKRLQDCEDVLLDVGEGVHARIDYDTEVEQTVAFLKTARIHPNKEASWGMWERDRLTRGFGFERAAPPI
jgi:hypothetical protein